MFWIFWGTHVLFLKDEGHVVEPTTTTYCMSICLPHTFYHHLPFAGFEDGNTIHVVRSRTAASPPGSGTAGNTSQASSGGGGGGPQGTQSGFNGGGQSGLGSMMQNPEAMSNMMNNPMMQSLTENPEMLRGIIESSPQMREMMNSNPELARAMRDPETLRNAMRAAQNPAYMREMMRHQDVAMANIQNMPGGFDAIRRMYEEVQEPLESSMQESAQQAAEDPLGALTGNPRQRRGEEETEEKEDSSHPLPNPWGGATQANRSQGACSLMFVRSRACCWVHRTSQRKPFPMHHVHEPFPLRHQHVTRGRLVLTTHLTAISVFFDCRR